MTNAIKAIRYIIIFHCQRYNHLNLKHGAQNKFQLDKIHKFVNIVYKVFRNMKYHKKVTFHLNDMSHFKCVKLFCFIQVFYFFNLGGQS